MNALKIALEKLNLQFTAETEFVVRYDEQPIGKFRADLLVENHGYEPQSKLWGIKSSAARDCSTYQFCCAAPGMRRISLSELEFHNEETDQ